MSATAVAPSQFKSNYKAMVIRARKGHKVYNPVNGTFNFRQGPIFCNVLLADEINRASPRTQSALLEAMNELQATVEGTCYTLPAPFLVLATQNPVEFHGTYPLPEAQLDRFLIQLDLGYPSPEVEESILHSQIRSHPLERLAPVLTRQEVLDLQAAVRQVRVEQAISTYVVEIINRTRRDERIKLGASPRASLMLFRAVQAGALVRGRDYALPDDVQWLAIHVLPHRLMLTSQARYGGQSKRQVVADILSQVKVPT